MCNRHLVSYGGGGAHTPHAHYIMQYLCAYQQPK